MRMGKRKNYGAGRAFALSLAVTLLTAAVVGGILVALERMENTLNTQKYTVFSLQKEKGDKFSLTALDHEYELDLSGMKKAGQRLDKVERVVPVEIRSFALAVDKLIGWLSGLIGKYI